MSSSFAVVIMRHLFLRAQKVVLSRRCVFTQALKSQEYPLPLPTPQGKATMVGYTLLSVIFKRCPMYPLDLSTSVSNCCTVTTT